MFEIKGKHTTAKVFAKVIDDKCIAQITAMTNHPAFTEPIAIMPDTHAGMGSVIGFTMPMTKYIIPNVIGVDIGCGMLTAVMPDYDKKFFTNEKLDRSIRQTVPFGMNVNNKPAINWKKDFPWQKLNRLALDFIEKYEEKFGIRLNHPMYSYEWMVTKCKQIGVSLDRVECAIGTLGGGNHFIEFGETEKGKTVITIHTGSRKLGESVCRYHQGIACKALEGFDTEDYQKKIEHIRNTTAGKDIPKKIKALRDSMKLDGQTKQMAYLHKIEDIEAYLFDMLFAQTYASENRKAIYRAIFKAIDVDVSSYPHIQAKDNHMETVHNYIDFRDLVMRKGAVAARKGEGLVIPLNMRDGVLFCTGRGNEEWNNSAPHGAGRVYSRSKAKAELCVYEFANQMDGIFSTSVCVSTLDEAPDAYKDSDMIKRAVEPTAKVVSHIRTTHNMKDKTKQKSWKERKDLTKNKKSDKYIGK